MTKRIVSFDIGIKNMAYCLFEVDETLETISIVEWKILDLTQSIEEPFCGTIQKGKKCKKKVEYVKNDMFVCKNHASSYTIPPTTRKFSSFTVPRIKEMIFHIQKECETKEKSKEEWIETLEKVYETYCWEIYKGKKTKTKDLDMLTIGRRLNTFLSENQAFDSLDYVLIENQISPIANRMKTIQGMLAQYFIMKNVLFIEFLSSSNKLKICPKEDGIQTYKTNKRNAVIGCEQWLTCFTEEWLSYFVSMKSKKDDLADCFLQGIWFLQKKLLKDAYNLKIKNVNTS